VLTEKSQRRLTAIKEFTELGSGYKISLRDLEIRGTGNILGPEQHGYVAAVGFDLYCQLLEQQVQDLLGQPRQMKDWPEVTMELPISAYIPDGYMPEQEKIYVYRRIKDAADLQAIADLQDELADRFGKFPPVLQNLLDIGRIRILAMALGLESITWTADQLKGTQGLVLTFLTGREQSHKLEDLRVRDKNKYDFRRQDRVRVYLRVNHEEILPELEQVLHLLTKIGH
jgi:transcription-repair coupling factor (superfamily II helicase)